MFHSRKTGAGYSAPKLWDLMGSGGVEPAEVYYEDFRVHRDQILGEKGRGFEILLYWISIEKLEGCMVAVALGQVALDEALKYTGNRTIKDRPLSKMQAVRHELAEMYSKVEACRWMVYRTAHIPKGNQSIFQREAAACKIFVQSIMSQVIQSSFRLHGCYGYTKDFKIERICRA